MSFAVFLILRNTSQTHCLGTWLTIRIITQTMKHLGIAYILFFTDPMKVFALVLGSKLTNHWGIVLAFFVYIHFVPNLKFGAKVYIFINVRKMALSDCLPSAAVCKDSLHTDFSSNSFSLKMLRICIVILLRVVRNNSVICAWVVNHR